jgi:hypothetical protein
MRLSLEARHSSAQTSGDRRQSFYFVRYTPIGGAVLGPLMSVHFAWHCTSLPQLSAHGVVL